MSEIVRAEVQAVMAIEQSVIDHVVSHLQNFDIQTPEQFTWAVERAKIVAQRKAALDAARKERVGPLTNTVRLLNSDYKPVLDAYSRAESYLRVAIARYTERQEDARIGSMQAGAPVAPPAVETVTGLAVKSVRRFEVTDPDLVPRQFCSPDMGKIKEFLDNGGIEAISGVRFYSENEIKLWKDR